MEGGTDVGRKKNRKRSQWNGFPSEEGGGRWKMWSRTPVYGSLRMKERSGWQVTERETGYRGYRLTLPLVFPCCATQNPHEEALVLNRVCILYIVVVKRQGGVCVAQNR